MKNIWRENQSDKTMEPGLKCVLLRSTAKVPTKGSLHSAGFDLCYAPEDDRFRQNLSTLILAPNERIIVPTGISVAISDGYYGRIAPRSGLAVNYGISVLAGVADSDFRGEIKVVLLNTGSISFQISPGDRIAQLIIEKIHPCNSFTVVDKLDDTQRGAGGFGSTGK